MSHAPIAWTDPARQAQFADWLHAVSARHALQADSLRPASADASFRRYFRIDSPQGPRIVMDAPPTQEDCQPFVTVAALLREGGLRAPAVLDWDAARGFMLLEDLGDRTLLQALAGSDTAAAAALYRPALAALVQLQRIPAEGRVPAYDRALLQREIELFKPWYIERHCGVTLEPEAAAQLDLCLARILDTCAAQPAVLVHRDFHSRNLMVGGPEGRDAPGVLDFQDAVWGPVSYDLVSLLRDAYVQWDEEVQIDWAIRWWEQARKADLPVDPDFGSFWRDFEWMGLQRHLKVLGIFARLHHRDGKDAYLADLPRVWQYAHKVATRYQGLGPLAHLLERLAGVQRLDAATF